MKSVYFQNSFSSPLLFSLYLDELLQKLRNLQLGCHIGGYWYGGCGYADDLILMAPNREVHTAEDDGCLSVLCCGTQLGLLHGPSASLVQDQVHLLLWKARQGEIP